MAKRAADCESSSNSPPLKWVQFEPVRIGSISTLEEMDIKVLQFQNKKLSQSEELMTQKKLRTEVIQLEDLLAQLREEYEMLRMEFEQNLAANEQTGPINREMRHLITSLQNHNQQLKGEVHWYKRKYKDANEEIPKLKKEIEDLTSRLGQQPVQEIQQGASSESSKEEEPVQLGGGLLEKCKDEPGSVNIKKEPMDEEPENEDTENGELDKQFTSPTIKKEKGDMAGSNGNANTPGAKRAEVKKKLHRDQHRSKVAKAPESELVRDLKAQLKKALNDQKELKLLLDMYKGVSKEQRDKVQLMASEKKIVELEDLRQQLKKLQKETDDLETNNNDDHSSVVNVSCEPVTAAVTVESIAEQNKNEMIPVISNVILSNSDINDPSSISIDHSSSGVETLLINRIEPNSFETTANEMEDIGVARVTKVAQTLQADSNGTIMISNLTGPETLSQESRRKIKETLNQQSFGSLSEVVGKEQLGNTNVLFDQCVFNAITLPNEQLNLESVIPPPPTPIMVNNLAVSELQYILPQKYGVSFEYPVYRLSFQTEAQLKSHCNEHKQTRRRGNKRRRGEARQLTEEETNQLVSQMPPNASISEKVLIASVAERDKISELKDPNDKFRSNLLHPNQCKFCPKSFRKPSDLTRHVRIHTGEKPFVCHCCFKSFTYKSTLAEHIKTHGSLKQFTCHVCGRQFATKGTLKVHMRLHTGSRPFRCPVCDQRFRTSGHRKAHLLSHIREAKQREAAQQTAALQDTDNATEEASIAEINTATSTISSSMAATDASAVTDAAVSLLVSSVEQTSGVNTSSALLDSIFPHIILQDSAVPLIRL